MIVTLTQLKSNQQHQVRLKTKTNAQGWPDFYTCNFLCPGLVSYEDVGADIAYLSKQTILEMLPSFKGKPVIDKRHKDVSPEDYEKYAVGYITRVWYDDVANWAMCEFILTDDEAKRSVSQGYSVSCAYDNVKTGPGGEKNAVRYGEEILGGIGNHLALVTTPRYEEARIQPSMMLVNSKKATVQNQNKEEVKMEYKFYRKANDKAGSDVDPKDPTKQKWNAENLFVMIENEMVSLSELAKHAKENEYVPMESVSNELELDGKVLNVSQLVENYKASKKNGEEKKEEEKKEEEKKENAEDKKEEDKKENADEKEEKGDKKESAKSEEDDTEEKIEKSNKNEKKDVQHYIKLNTIKENGREGVTLTIDTMQNRVGRGKSAYGSNTASGK